MEGSFYNQSPKVAFVVFASHAWFVSTIARRKTHANSENYFP